MHYAGGGKTRRVREKPPLRQQLERSQAIDHPHLDAGAGLIIAWTLTKSP